MNVPAPNTFFLHGLDSSIQGTKAQWFRQHFPQVGMQNYHGGLGQRLEQMEAQLAGLDHLTLIGSSFGGLMAACFALHHPERCRMLILLAPALNFNEYHPPAAPITVPVLLVMGEHDDVCPPALVLPQAQASFRELTVRLEDDGHMLHRTFPALDWANLLT